MREISQIKMFIKENYMEMYMRWAENSENGFFREMP